MKTIHELPKGLNIGRHFVTTPGWNLITFRSMEDGTLSFLRLPSVTNQKPIEQWSIPPFPFGLKAFAVYPPDNLLAVAEEKEQ